MGKVHFLSLPLNQMAKKALFPGTFDPFTNGHLDIVNRGLELFDEVIVAVGVNTGKANLFSVEQRLEWLEDLFAHNPRVKVVKYEGLTAKYAEQVGAGFILRGLRTTQDFTYEQQIAFVNEDMAPGVHNVFIMSNQQNTSVSSTIVRDLIRHHGEFKKYVPEVIYTKISQS